MEASSNVFNSSLLWVLLGGLGIAVGSYFLLFRKPRYAKLSNFDIISKLTSLPEPKRLEVITFQNILGWFKRPEIADAMCSNSALMAIALKDKITDGYRITLCTFNKTNDKIEKVEILEAPKIDERIELQFGSKSMIIFK